MDNDGEWVLDDNGQKIDVTEERLSMFVARFNKTNNKRQSKTSASNALDFEISEQQSGLTGRILQNKASKARKKTPPVAPTPTDITTDGTGTVGAASSLTDSHTRLPGGQMTLNFPGVPVSKQREAELDGAIADFVHSNGLPFSLCEDPTMPWIRRAIAEELRVPFTVRMMMMVTHVRGK